MIEVVESKNFELNCAKCNSRLSYHYSDVKEYKCNLDYLGEYDLIKGIKCPVCGVVTGHKRGY